MKPKSLQKLFSFSALSTYPIDLTLNEYIRCLLGRRRSVSEGTTGNLSPSARAIKYYNPYNDGDEEEGGGSSGTVVPTGGGVVDSVLVITICHCSYVFIDVCFRTSHCFAKFTAGLSGLVVILLGRQIY